MQLAADHLVHAWDLGRALGADPDLDPEAVAAVARGSRRTEDAYRQAGRDRPAGRGAGRRRTRSTSSCAMFGTAAVNALAAVERFNAAFDAKDVDAIMAAMTPDCVFEDTAPPDGQRHVGADAVRAAWSGAVRGLPRGARSPPRRCSRPATGSWCVALPGTAATCAAWTCSPSGTAWSPRSWPTSRADRLLPPVRR